MHQSVKFKPFDIRDLPRAYSKYKMALAPVIEDTFGWDEEFQQMRFRNQYELNWFNWVEINNECVGYICYWKKSSEIHIALLIIDSDKQNFGYGHLVMENLHMEAHNQNCKVTLSSFRKNQAAIRFYKGIGYLIVGGDEHFVDMVRSAR